MRYITDRQVESIPALQRLDEDARAQVLSDASRIYRHVRRNEWIDDEQLRSYGERNELPPDRLNAALRLLRDTGQLVEIGDGPPPPVPAPEPEEDR